MSSQVSQEDSSSEHQINNEDQVHGRVVSWQNLSFKVAASNKISCIPNRCRKNNAEKTILLHPMSGELPPAQCMAVMGSSGAGKTTFLSALANQLKGGTKDGTITVDGQPLTNSLFKQLCGFVKQDDVLLPSLTVRETIEFYADLRLPRSMNGKEKKKRVDMAINKLGLRHCQHTPIGDANQRGISGGEKRRVSIAVELIRNPTIIFLDEPTSGLDSCTALSVVNTLADLAHNYNHTVICTIHQPRSTAFSQFDRVMLLAKGHQIYCGPTVGAEQFFLQMGLECPEYENPADFYIDMLTLDSTSAENEDQSKRRVNDIIEFAETHKHQLQYIQHSDEGEKQVAKGARPHKQIYLIAKRSLVCTTRNMGLLIGRFSESVITAICAAILWWQIGDDQTTIQDRIAVIFSLLVGISFPEGVAGTFMFPREREVFRRETTAGMYRLSSYFIGKQAAEFPLQIFAPALYVFIAYWTVGLPADIWKFGSFLSICMLVSSAHGSLGMLTGALFNAQAANIYFPCILIVDMLLGGFYVNPENIPTWINWAKYLSMYYYAFQALLLDQFRDLKFVCESDQFETLIASGTCPDGTVLQSVSVECPYTRGTQIVDNYNAGELELWQYQLILLSFAIFYRILIYPALRFAKPREVGA